MIILIAEAKTMTRAGESFTPAQIAAHRPLGEKEADKVMAALAAMEVSDIARVVKISYDMAASLKQMAYEFPNKELGRKAIEAYTGVVFRNLGFADLSDPAKERCIAGVRILSSLYGYLRPDDIVKPYRLEYTTPLAPADVPMYTYLKDDTTSRLLAELKERGDCEILNLLPADAAKCIDWRRVNEVASVAKVDFKDTSGDKIRSPHAGKLKAFRGQLLRHILTDNLTTLEQVAHFRNDDMMPGDSTLPGVISFYV